MRKWFIKLFVYWVGVKFYRTDFEPTTAEVVRSVFKTGNNFSVEFRFYRETYKDTIFRWGKFRKTSHDVLIVQAFFDNELDSPALKFNNTRYSFKANWLPWIEDETLANILLGIYLEYINVKSQGKDTTYGSLPLF